MSTHQAARSGAGCEAYSGGNPGFDSVQAPDGELGGLAVDVTPALVLRTQAGDTEVRAGDVTLVRMEG